MQFDGVDVSQYKYLMWTLVSRFGDPKLSTIVQHTAKKATFAERMAIVKGINHIGEPCSRVLDFRIYFYELCKAYELNGIRHFLDPESIEVFNALLEKTAGRYTLGVYEELDAYAKRRYARLPPEEKEVRTDIEAKLVNMDRTKIDSIRKYGLQHDVAKVDLDNNLFIDSIEQRVLEQHYLNNNRSLFYTLDSGLNNFRPTTVFLSDANYDFWQSLQIESHSCVVSALLLKPEFQSILAQSQRVTKFYLLKKLLVNDQVDYVAIDIAKLSVVLTQHPEITSAITSEEVRLVKIDISPTSVLNNVHSPSVLRSHNNVRLQAINREPPKDVVNLLSPGNKVLSISDVTNMLQELKLFKAYRKDADPDDLPVSLLQYVIRPRFATQKVKVAVNNNNDCRMEDRYNCNTTCIVIDPKTKKSIVGKTHNFSTKGLAIKLPETVEFDMGSRVLITLPSVSKRMGRLVKNQSYTVIESDGTYLRLKVEGVAKHHDGRQLLIDFLNRYNGQLKANGKQEDLCGLTQALRSVVSANHESLPFTYVMDKRASFIEHIGIGNASISNLDTKQFLEDIKTMASSRLFAEYVKDLYWQLTDEVTEVTGYVLLLPSVTTRSGKQHMFWVEDLNQLEKEKQGYDFINKLSKVANPSILSIRLCKAKPLNDKYFVDELHHLERVHPVAVEGLSYKDDDIMAYGEISEITELFMLEQPEVEEEMLIEI